MTTLDQLSDAERRVLTLVAQGQRNAQIAHELCISTRTVGNHLYHIFDKLGVSCRTEAALCAWNTGLLSNAEMSQGTHDKADDNVFNWERS